MRDCCCFAFNGEVVSGISITIGLIIDIEDIGFKSNVEVEVQERNGPYSPAISEDETETHQWEVT